MKQTTEAVIEELHSAIEAMMTSDTWQKALDTMALFHSYSFANQMLIAIAHANAYRAGLVDTPSPSLVAGYNAWKRDHNRQVMKGQKGYPILAPVIVKDEEDNSKCVGFRLVYVFDIAQTAGDDVVTLPQAKPISDSANELHLEAIRNYITSKGYTVSTADYLDGANGVTIPSDKQVKTLSTLSSGHTLKTLIHETAHIALHTEDTFDYVAHRGIAETEAESVAYVVAKYLGLDTTDYSVPYVSNWASHIKATDMAEKIEAVKRTASNVQRVSNEIIKALT